MIRRAIGLIRPLAATWAASACLPVPVILMLDSSENAIISCLYLGLGAAYLAMAVIRASGIPESRSGWWSRIAAIGVAVAINVIVFIGLGRVVGMQTNLPLALLAALSVIPAMGLVPWLTLRIRRPVVVMVSGAVVLLAAKLSGCIAARIVYGAQYVEAGYASMDWQTAKLMISLFWILVTTISLGLLLAGHWQLKRDEVCVKPWMHEG